MLQKKDAQKPRRRTVVYPKGEAYTSDVRRSDAGGASLTPA
jgi:hypothetical protein